MAGCTFCGLTISERASRRVGHFDDADVGLDGAEGVVLGGDAGLGEGVEEGRFADVGQADDAALESHGIPLMFSRFRPDVPEKAAIVNHRLGFPEKGGFGALHAREATAAFSG
jgi:hypothetical protein